MKGVFIISAAAALLVVAMVQVMVKPGQAAVTCQDVNACLAPCVPYLTSGAGTPSTACCGGVAKLQKIAQTTADKQAACNCAKNAAAQMPALKEDAAASLPAKCNVQVNFPISRNTNCQDIH